MQLSFSDADEVARLQELIRMAVWLAQNTHELSWFYGTEQKRRATRAAYIQELTEAGFWKEGRKHGSKKEKAIRQD